MQVMELAAPTVPATAPGITKTVKVLRYFLKPLPGSIGKKCVPWSRASPTDGPKAAKHRAKASQCDPGIAAVKRRLSDMNALGQLRAKPDAAKRSNTDKTSQAPKHLKHILG